MDWDERRWDYNFFSMCPGLVSIERMACTELTV